MQRLWILVPLALVLGCSEQLIIRSVPPGAQVTLNGSPAGTTPMVYQTRNPVPLDYRIELPGMPAAEGTVTTRLGPGRVVGAVFTLGIVAACRPLKYFIPNPLDVELGSLPVAVPPTATLRLYNVKAATVLEGECVRETGTCRVTLPSGEECPGDFVREAAGGRQDANGTQGVAVLKCRGSIIDCKLTLDTSGMQGHGECSDTRGITYRATLLPTAGVH
jgi:hypothetical protein